MPRDGYPLCDDEEDLVGFGQATVLHVLACAISVALLHLDLSKISAARRYLQETLH